MHTFKTKFQQPLIPAFMVRSVSLSCKAQCRVFCVSQPPVFVLSPPAGVERQFLSSDGPAGSQRGAQRPEEEQRHQQLQRQPHLDPLSLWMPAGSRPPAAETHLLCPDCGRSHRGRVTSLELDGSACSPCLCCMTAESGFGNTRVISALSDTILQIHDSGCCDCLGHVRCSLTSLPLSTRSFSTVPLLLEQRFSAGRCPSSSLLPHHHQNCQPYCHAASCRCRVKPCTARTIPVPSSSFPTWLAKSGDRYRHANISQQETASLLQL